MPTLPPTPNPRKTRRLQALFFASVAVLILLIVASRGRRQNWERTRADHPEIILRTRFYQSDVAQANRAVVKAIGELKTYDGAWSIKSNDGENIRVEVPVLFFTDDLVVTIRARESAKSALKVPQGAVKVPQDAVWVDVRSTARVGKGDFGENRRHVLQLLDALDRTLQSAA